MFATACLDGEHMFEEISDDVYLVEKNDQHAFTKYKDSVTGSWLYRHFVSVVLYVTEKINTFSKEYRKIMQTLFIEKKMLMVSLCKENNEFGVQTNALI